jgi:hypothetical protein
MAFSRFSTVCVSSLLLASTVALAQTPKSLGKYGAWHAYKKGEVCYMVSLAKKSEGKYTKRGNVYAVVTHRPKIKSKNVLSLHAGYPFGKGDEVKVTVKSRKGNKVVNLFTEGEVAWCADAKTDNMMAEQLTKIGSEMLVEGKSSRGTKTKDTYSLAGSLKAYNAICKACGVS